MSTSRGTAKIIQGIVEETLPAGAPFELLKETISLNNLYILRVITPAWRRKAKMERYGKMQDAVFSRLSPAEQESIYRISVLTPEEWEVVKKERTAKGRIRKIGGSPGVAAATL